MRIRNHFHINGFALSLVLKVRFFGTRKWPIAVDDHGENSRRLGSEKGKIFKIYVPKRKISLLFFPV